MSNHNLDNTLQCVFIIHKLSKNAEPPPNTDQKIKRHFIRDQFSKAAAFAQNLGLSNFNNIDSEMLAWDKNHLAISRTHS